MKKKALINLIDYLLVDGGADCCAKCAYNCAGYSGNVPDDFCREFTKDGNVACRNGMIKFFHKKEKKK